MYSVRRFSTTSYIEEREYNIVSDLYHSGLGRTSKKVIGKVRRGLGAKIEKSIINDRNKLVSLSNRKNEVITNDKVMNNLVNEANKRNTSVLVRDKGEASFDTSNIFSKNKIKEYKDSINKNLRNPNISEVDRKYLLDTLEEVNELEKGRNIISYPSNSGIETLSHELGHADNYLSKNKIKNYISRSYKDNKSSVTPENVETSRGGLLNFINTYTKGKLELEEEKNATRKGLNLLKISGASKEEIKRSKDELNKSLESYNLGHKMNYKSSLRNTIQIPSRKRNLGLGDYGYGKSDPGTNIRVKS